MISRFVCLLVLKRVVKRHAQLFCLLLDFMRKFAVQPRQRKGLIRGAVGALFCPSKSEWKESGDERLRAVLYNGAPISRPRPSKLNRWGLCQAMVEPPSLIQTGI